jgi:hypothetical protein
VHVCKPRAQEPGDPVVGPGIWRRGPRCESTEDDSDGRRREVGQAHSTVEVGEQHARCVVRGGAGGGKGSDRGESGRANQVPDTGPDKERTWRTLNGHAAGNR